MPNRAIMHFTDPHEAIIGNCSRWYCLARKNQALYGTLRSIKTRRECAIRWIMKLAILEEILEIRDSDMMAGVGCES